MHLSHGDDSYTNQYYTIIDVHISLRLILKLGSNYNIFIVSLDDQKSIKYDHLTVLEL